MDLGIAGKTALVLGASRGIGRGIANSLAAEGVNLLLVARNLQRLDALSSELNSLHLVDVGYLQQDMGEPDAVAKILAEVEKLNIDIDILVCVTGGPAPGTALGTEAEVYRKQFDSMITPCIEITRKLVVPMMKREWGRVITITSSGVVQPLSDLVVSNTLRSGLVNWNKSLSNEVAKYGVTINTLIPGKIKTERLDEIDIARASRNNESLEQVVSKSQSSIPMQRYGTVEEFASAATFLASAPASYITGNCLRVDGGFISSI